MILYIIVDPRDVKSMFYSRISRKSYDVVMQDCRTWVLSDFLHKAQVSSWKKRKTKVLWRNISNKTFVQYAWFDAMYISMQQVLNPRGLLHATG